MRGGRVPFLLLSNFILPGNLKRGDFSNENPLMLGVSGGRDTAIHARSAEVSDRPNNNE